MNDPAKTRAPVPAEGEVPVSPQPSSPRREAAWVGATALVTSVIAAVCLRLWHMQIHIPLFPEGDETYTHMLIKTAMREGWFGINPHIGAPFGGTLYDHTAVYGDSGQLAFGKVLGFFSSDPAAVLNALFLLGFPIVAAVAYLVLRSLGFARGISLTCAVVYALMPFHFLRGEAHLALGMYWSVPVAAWLCFGALGHVTLFVPRDAGGGRVTRWLSRRTLLTLLACLVVGVSGLYYAVFLIAILGLTALCRLLVERDVRALLAPAVICVAVVGAMVLVQVPQIVYHASHGATSVAKRTPLDTKTYGLKV